MPPSRTRIIRSCLANTVVTVLTLACTAMETSYARDAEPLLHGHAHNDYRNKRPLLDALEYGFTSVEVDIFLRKGKLLVGHDLGELSPQRTLQSLYLDPLRERVQAHQGNVYKTPANFYLLVDIKSGRQPTYAKLREVLAEYAPLLSTSQDGQFKQGPVTVVLSGKAPKKELLQKENTFASLDGRLSDLERNLPSFQMPLISDRWTSHFRWMGKGPFPSEEKERLHEIVRKAHQKGRLVRFWDTPESEQLWQELLHAEVDLINTDKLSKLSRFIRSNRNQKTSGSSKSIFGPQEESPFFVQQPWSSTYTTGGNPIPYQNF